MKKLKKIVLWTIGILLGLFLLLRFVGMPILLKNTKKHSPEKTVSHSSNGLQIDVFYCSPSKKRRVVFGELIPYGEVWRTGANEASTFTTNKDIVIDGKTLPAGKYTLWTIPNETQWEVIFNSKMYDWGVRFQDAKASREAEFDVASITINSTQTPNIIEDFTINLKTTEGGMLMTLAWDDTEVPVNIGVK